MVNAHVLQFIYFNPTTSIPFFVNIPRNSFAFSAARELSPCKHNVSTCIIFSPNKIPYLTNLSAFSATSSGDSITELEEQSRIAKRLEHGHMGSKIEIDSM
ncbi:MAG: hypothetical protein ACYC6R_16925 [Anaerolineales bacterium]